METAVFTETSCLCTELFFMTSQKVEGATLSKIEKWVLNRIRTSQAVLYFLTSYIFHTFYFLVEGTNRDSNSKGLSSGKYWTGSSVCCAVCPSSKLPVDRPDWRGVQSRQRKLCCVCRQWILWEVETKGCFLLYWVNHLCLPFGGLHPSVQYKSYPTLICVPSHKGCFLEPK